MSMKKKARQSEYARRKSKSVDAVAYLAAKDSWNLFSQSVLRISWSSMGFSKSTLSQLYAISVYQKQDRRQVRCYVAAGQTVIGR